MIALIQRVTRAEVRVGEHTIAAIELGIAALVGVRRTDEQSDAERLIERMLGYRIFPDPAGRMNLDLRSVGGDFSSFPNLRSPQTPLAECVRASARQRLPRRRARSSGTSCSARASATSPSPAAHSGRTCSCR